MGLYFVVGCCFYQKYVPTGLMIYWYLGFYQKIVPTALKLRRSKLLVKIQSVTDIKLHRSGLFIHKIQKHIPPYIQLQNFSTNRGIHL